MYRTVLNGMIQQLFMKSTVLYCTYLILSIDFHFRNTVHRNTYLRLLLIYLYLRTLKACKKGTLTSSWKKKAKRRVTKRYT